MTRKERPEAPSGEILLDESKIPSQANLNSIFPSLLRFARGADEVRAFGGIDSRFEEALERVWQSEEANKIREGRHSLDLASSSPGTVSRAAKVLRSVNLPAELASRALVAKFDIDDAKLLGNALDRASALPLDKRAHEVVEWFVLRAQGRLSYALRAFFGPHFNEASLNVTSMKPDTEVGFWRAKIIGSTTPNKKRLTLTYPGILFYSTYLERALPCLSNGNGSGNGYRRG